MRVFKKFYLAVLFSNIIFSQSTWIYSGRIHPELNWSTLETANFNIHYHQGLENMALKGAAIAEQVRPVLLQQLNQTSLPKIDIIFTSEDEIMNGFALWTYTTFIWVDQNDAAIWLEDEKWLYQVLSHELQHIVFFHALKSWILEPWGYLLSGTPGWFVEGLAEYGTERWRPYRADLSHKSHIITNKIEDMDPHHDGFSKLLYWSDRFGDSTIVKTIKYRTRLKTPNFKTGFKKATGITVKQFNEDWRRQMNTYYYGIRAQKETLEEVGEPATLPLKKMQGFLFSPDSLKIALIGSDDKNQKDVSLFIAVRNIKKEKNLKQKWESRKKQKPSFFRKFFGSDSDSVGIFSKFIWDKTEIDYGRFHSALSWSPAGNQLVYAKYHYGRHQAMVWDLRLYDTVTKKKRWLTRSLRATYPQWSPDSNRIVFVAHKLNVSNLYVYSINSDTIKALTNYMEDTQITYPAWSPSGKKIAFSASGPEGNMDIYILNLEFGLLEKITDDASVDYKPIWSPNGESLVFTSHRGGTPNIYSIDLSSKIERQITDVGEAIWAQQWLRKDSVILAATMDVTDSVRIIKVNPHRIITTKPLSIRSGYSSWIEAGPKYKLIKGDLQQRPEILGNRRYKAWKLKHLTSLIIPGKNPFAMTQWTDAMGRSLIGAGFYLNPEKYKNSGGYLSYTNALMGALWSLNLYQRIYASYRPYDDSKSGLTDIQDGLIFTLEKPYNRGTHLSREQRFGLRIKIINHTVSLAYKARSALNRNLPFPENGREGLFSLYYQWLNRRPHKWNWYNPTQGTGIFAKLDIASQKIYGDFTYRQFSFDSFFNLSLSKTALYFRFKTVLQNGRPPAQNYVGLTDDQPLYFPIPLPTLSLVMPENHNLRGWQEYRLGNRLIFGTVEYRLPVLPKFISLAVFSDYGQAWTAGEKLEEFIVTGGYEARLTLPIFSLSAGVAQTRQGWNSKNKPEKYFRLVLINPF